MNGAAERLDRTEVDRHLRLWCELMDHQPLEREVRDHIYRIRRRHEAGALMTVTTAAVDEIHRDIFYPAPELLAWQQTRICVR